MTRSRFPRLVVAGLSGDSGKTLVSLGLLVLARQQGLDVRGFKKGPDYIDAAWLRWASRHPPRNLDTYLMGFEGAVRSFSRHAVSAGLNVVEGNRGLYDGSDSEGTHSTATLAKLLAAPVILVVTPAKVTRTAAALVLGCQKLDPAVQISGVILNRVDNARHERILRSSIESVCGVPVLGVLPKMKEQELVPGRHLGLVTPEEHRRIGELRQNLLQCVEDRVDFEHLLSLAQATPDLEAVTVPETALAGGRGLKIGYLSDSAFTFYYPENLEALEAGGARLAPISALHAQALPEHLDALYIGGGFPETHGASLAANTEFLASLRGRAAAGLPIYAECGGLMLLSRAIRWNGQRFPMAGVFPFEVEVHSKPQGHGYSELVVDQPNPFFQQGLTLRGHEFHYSRILTADPLPSTACSVARGTGCFAARDGVVSGNSWASYTHLHALATPQWPEGLLAAARRHRGSRLFNVS